MLGICTYYLLHLSGKESMRLDLWGVRRIKRSEKNDGNMMLSRLGFNEVCWYSLPLVARGWVAVAVY